MAGSVNRVFLIGNVVRDPEIRTTQSGQKIAQISLATSETWNDKASGERKERAEFHRIVVFNERLADLVEKFVRKGTKLYVEDALQTRKWTDKDGAEKYSTEVVLKPFRGEITMLSAKSAGAAPAQAPARREAAPAPQRGADLADEIPF